MNEIVDPYRSPESSLVQETEALPLVLAGLWRRFFTYLIDSVAIGLVNFAVLLGLVLATGLHNGGQIGLWPRLGLSLAVALAFLTFFEAAWGRTPGKWVCGTAVVQAGSGKPPTLAQAFVRSISRNVPFEAFSIFGDEPVAWHDSWAKTRVVRTR